MRFPVIAVLTVLSAWIFAGCSDDGIDNRDTNYGYAQFKLYKAASYTATPQSRAIQSQLDYLSEASKVRVTMMYDGMTIAQTLTLSASDDAAAEYGLRSQKIKLLTGKYEIVTFMLYDSNDNEIYNGTPLDNELEVLPGGLVMHDLTVNVAPRGKVRFSLIKNMEDFTDTPTRSVLRQYTMDEIANIDITVMNRATSNQVVFERLPMTFSMHFDDDDATYGYRTSSSKCDSVLFLPAGEYEIVSYLARDNNQSILEVNPQPKSMSFVVTDNATTEAKVPITLYETDGYIQDYYALYEIWKSLDGPNWSYEGENFPDGCNWDFNRDVDLWGSQPGVELYSNGRVASINISEFGFRGDMSPAIGRLTELAELYLGTHNDMNLQNYDPSLAFDQPLAERQRRRMENHGKYLHQIHTPTQFSQPCALALAEHNISIPATELYNTQSEKDIIDPKTGIQKHSIHLYDMVHGKLCNGLKSLPKEIGNLKKLTMLYLANSEITELPDEMAQLESCTDLEIYNCPKMTSFPMAITKMPSLISVNISNNSQWTDIDAGLVELAKGASGGKVQILYSRDNSSTVIPEEFTLLKRIGMLDMSNNKIKTASPLGKEISFVQLYLDNNLLETLPVAADGYFCGIADLETLSVKYNKLKKVPNIFTAHTQYQVTTADFTGNQITGFEGEDDGTFKGINVETLTLENNPTLTKFPKCLATSDSQVVYLLLRACSIDEIPEGSLTGKNSNALTSLDLSYNKMTKLPTEFTADNIPYLYGLDLSYNSFASFPWRALNPQGLTVLSVRCQRDAKGARCLKEWPTGVYQHKGLRGLFLGSNDLRTIDDTISYLIYNLDISDNPNITFDASNICSAWRNQVYFLIYDKTQNILNCDDMLK